MRDVRTHAQSVAVAASPGGGTTPGAHAVPAVHQDDAQPVGALGRGQRGDQGPQQLRTSAARRALDQQMRAVGREIRADRAARAAPSTAQARPPSTWVSSAASAQRAISDAGVALASPNSSSSRAAWGNGTETRACRSVPEPSVRSGASARANRSAQGRRRRPRRPRCRGLWGR